MNDFQIIIDGEPAGTLEGLLKQPENEGVFTADQMAALRALKLGQTFEYFAGAGGITTIQRA
jgi:hypothetical protein